MSLENIKKMYDKLNYFDQFGGSVILFIIISIILIISISYCFININSQPIIDDWPNQRCKPYIIPYAGFITHPEGVSAIDYTYQNFTFCTQNILSSITGMAVEPVTFVLNLLKNMSGHIKTEINSIRGMFNKVRSMFQDISEEIMGRIINFTIPLQQIIISFKDLIGKIQGTMTAGLFTLLGSYYTLKSLMGAIAEFIIKILITLVALIAVFWIFPFTWGAAISNTAIFIAIAIPMVIILSFMINVLHVQTKFKMPKLKCFDENTLLKMNDNTEKKILDIQVNDILQGNNRVTACFIVESNGSIIYDLDGINVSDSHLVKYNEKWIPIKNHPKAIKLDSYEKPFLFCLNTSNKVINIKDFIFTDWDEIMDDEFNEIKSKCNLLINNKNNIHTFLDSGIVGTTKIKLKNNSYKYIKDIKIGDKLINGEIVYGLVKINGNTIKEQFKYNLGNNLFVEGSQNLNICDKKFNFNSTLNINLNKKNINNYSELYHLLTDKKTFYIGDCCFYDYNAAIDLFLDKNKKNYYL
jgi:hypothetical protein